MSGLRPSRGTLRFAAGLVLALIFAWLTLRGVPMEDLRAAFAEIAPWQLALGCACLAAGYAVRIRRWQVMLRCFAPRVGYAACSGPFVASFAINNLVPLRAGDIMRTFAFEGQIGVAPSRVAATLIMERLLDLLTLLVFLAVALALLGGVDPRLRDVAVGALGLGIVALGLVLLAPLTVYRLLYTLYRRRAVRRARLLRRVLRFAMTMLISLPRLSRPILFARLVVLSLVSWAFEAAVFAAAALHAAIVPAGALSALSASTLMTLVPGTPGHLGTFDFGAKLGYLAAGLAEPAATAAALFAHALVWLPITIAGGLWLLTRAGLGRRMATPQEGPSR